VIDQLRSETFGVFALEPSPGQPVISTSAVPHREVSPDLPIVNANPVTGESVLADLLDDPGLRSRLERDHAPTSSGACLSTLGP